MNRNNVVYNWQFNRNPFIDQPDLVEYIWGNKVGFDWNQPLNIESLDDLSIQIFPNPTSKSVHFKGLKNEANVDVYTMDGRYLMSDKIIENSILDLDVEQGIYLLRISSEGQSIIKKIIVN